MLELLFAPDVGDFTECLQYLHTVALILIFFPHDGQACSDVSLAINVSQQPLHSYVLSFIDSGSSAAV